MHLIVNCEKNHRKICHSGYQWPVTPGHSGICHHGKRKKSRPLYIMANESPKLSLDKIANDPVTTCTLYGIVTNGTLPNVAGYQII